MGQWSTITPDEHGDWLDQRDVSFDAYPVIADMKNPSGKALFCNYSAGVKTNRDAWCINPCRRALTQNIRTTIAFYNDELERWNSEKRATEATDRPIPNIDDFVNSDRARISWSSTLKRHLMRSGSLSISDGQFLPSTYRPFTKAWLFYSKKLNDRVGRMPRIFPDSESPNRVIAVSGKGARSGFSALMLDSLAELQVVANGQCFPLWLYDDEAPDAEPDMLSDLDDGAGVRRSEAITDYALELFTSAYPTETICREDIFHYIYGLLHAEDYRKRFRANLAKELPRIPCVASVEDYRAFRDAGRHLGELHVGYESVDRYAAEIDTGGVSLDGMAPETAYRVSKMKHPGTGSNKDITTVIYNRHITVRGIPQEAWDYVVSGKSALQWVMLRQCVTTHKASGIVSDANRYAIETVGDPRYPLDLLLRVITVSLETMKIVRVVAGGIGGPPTPEVASIRGFQSKIRPQPR